MKPNQYLNDLEWLLSEREMFISDRPLADFLLLDWQHKFRALTQRPDAIVAYMAQAKSHFLGTYFEQLFSFAIHHFTDLEVLAEHQQIQGERQTLGEVDLLAKDRTGRCIQFEVAIKFYLERSDLAPNNWIGPNKNDSLNKKVSHARGHQLTVLDQVMGQQWLHSVTGSTDYKPNLMIFGRHFYNLNARACIFFDEFEIQGGWLYKYNLSNWAPYLSDLVLAGKPCWITPNREKDTINQIDGTFIEALEKSFRHDQRPQLYSCWRRDKNNQQQAFWLFICPEGW
ncbi:DUF1853 family protein [Marinomonas ostreistagni]|uniref:DUF1853 family protein n=1 Tax=Marinomonas ostreistagni TaxID=359209 RepID=UPI00194EBD36|nr:DUF1853 family protein [Marinomonas ostreistagni]MBM6551951.1 DUF1853 family protein [Marinomonas ostreistagni]